MFAQHQALTAQPQPTPNGAAHDPLSLADYTSRRSYVFDEAEAAFWSAAICAEAYMLFRLLTRLCKERTYCWPGLDYLAARLQTSVGTVKRRLDRLERAGLIERRQRPGGLTSTTYVVPLQRYDAARRAGTAPEPQLREAPAVLEPDSGAPQVSAPLFFVPQQEISSAPTDRSALIPHTMKNQNVNPGGGRKQLETAELSGPAINLLTEAGVLSPQVLAELKHTPPADVAACLDFAQQQPHIVDPAAFAVSLIRQGLGSKLAQRPQRQLVRRTSTAAPTTSPNDPARYHAYHCEHGQIRGGCADCAQRSAERRTARLRHGAADGARPAACDVPPQTEPLWPDVLALLQQRVAAAEFSAWLSETVLLRADDDRVVIGTPNVFVRERLASEYEPLIVAALELRLGRRPPIEYVIGVS